MVSQFEAIIYVTPATIAAFGSAVAAVIAAKRGTANHAKLQELDAKKLEPIKDAVNGAAS